MITAKTFAKAAQFILVVLLFVSTMQGAAGDLDPGFNAAGAYLSYGDYMNDFVVQPDGKILVGGGFAVANETARQGIVRLNADGSLDTTFRAPDFQDPVSRAYGATIRSIKLQADGKILVGGRFDVVGTTYKHIIRLNPDGSLDTTFTNHSAQFAADQSVNEIELQANGAILISGNLSMGTQTSYTQMVARLNGTDGSIDPTLRFVNPGVPPRELAVQPDGKILISDQNMARFNPDGTVDNSFPAVVSGGIEKILVKPDGKIIIGGQFTTVNGFQQHRVAQINSDGSFDTNFNSNNLGANGTVYDIALDANGKILIVGDFGTYNGIPRNRIARLNSDGSLDLSFSAPPPPFALKTVIPLSNGQIFVASSESINRINTDGTWDFTLNQPRLGTIGGVTDVIQQPDGKLVIAGRFDTVNGVPRNLVARLNLDGTLDSGFVPFFTGTFFSVNSIAIQSTGKILVAVANVVYRLNTDGTRDLGFSSSVPQGTNVTDLYVYPDDKILVGGLIKLLPDGARDTSFNPPSINGPIFATAVQPDGKIVFGGDFTLIGGTTQRGYIGRWNTDGSLDTTFNTLIGANAPVHGLDLQPDGKVIAVGRFTFMNNDPTRKYIARLNTNGSVDTSFSSVLGIYFNAPFLPGLFTVKIQPDGKVLIGGTLFSVNGVTRNNYARLNSNGSLDPTFNAIPGADGHVVKIRLQSDNKILLAGYFTKVNGVSKIGIARLLNSQAVARTSFDYDGDGKADISVFRPSENKWYVLRSSDGQVTQIVFAIAGDVPVPADFDGDGKTDFAVFRPSTGDWWWLSSQNGSQGFADWGQSGDAPRPSDFDGDGKADFIVYRPSNSFWYRITSTVGGTTSNTGFGLAGDKPVTGDFDGDGKADVAIYRPSTGDWWWQSSVDNVQRATHWGISTDIPAPADYDGDGKTDFAVYRPSTGTWYIYNSATNSLTILNFGLSEDKPVPADYDGDGKADIAVFRPSTGVWYQMKSTEGFFAQQFGISTDIPTPNAFVP